MSKYVQKEIGYGFSSALSCVMAARHRQLLKHNLRRGHRQLQNRKLEGTALLQVVANVCRSFLHRVRTDSLGSQRCSSQEFLLKFSIVWGQRCHQNITAKCSRYCTCLDFQLSALLSVESMGKRSVRAPPCNSFKKKTRSIQRHILLLLFKTVY